MVMEIPELRDGIKGVRHLGSGAMTFRLGRRTPFGRVCIEMGKGCRDDYITTNDCHSTNNFSS